MAIGIFCRRLTSVNHPQFFSFGGLKSDRPRWRALAACVSRSRFVLVSVGLMSLCCSQVCGANAPRTVALVMGPGTCAIPMHRPRSSCARVILCILTQANMAACLSAMSPVLRTLLLP